MKTTLEKLLEKFRGDDYFRPVTEGQMMVCEEIRDNPIRKHFRVLLNQDKTELLEVRMRDTIGLFKEKSSLFEPTILEDLKVLLNQDKVVATIFVN